MFSQCYTNGPICMPARATMMTGQYVREHGVWQNVVAADQRGPSHVRNVRDAGYHTALVGKTHLYTHTGGTKSQEKTAILENWGVCRYSRDARSTRVGGEQVAVFGLSRRIGFVGDASRLCG